MAGDSAHSLQSFVPARLDLGRIRPLSRLAISLTLTLLTIAATRPAVGQQPASPPAPTAPQQPEPPASSPPTEPPLASPPEGQETTSESTSLFGPQERFLPHLDVYFPEGDLDLRVNRLVSKTFFEGQIKYNFVNGDITAFLRYRYYGANRITQFAVFDSINFDRVEKFSNDFDRVRGALVFLQWPKSYKYRLFALGEIDRISSNRQDLLINDNGQTNTFIRYGLQYGAPGDPTSDAIVGETRARIDPLFTAAREFGPGDSVVTAAVSYGFKVGPGDFNYVKVETEGAKRFDFSSDVFMIGRLHVGGFPFKTDAKPNSSPFPIDHLLIPRAEFFSLGGRENLKGLKNSLDGTEEIHNTWELFFPWFLSANRDFLHLTWQNWYWVAYAGVGNSGFSSSVYTSLHDYIPDVGLGFESSLQVSRYRFFLAGVLAHSLKGSEGLEARVSLKSYR